MKYTLIENGADSFKSAFENIEAFDDIVEGGHHRLKDAVIFLNHGVEILLKSILKKHSASLMFKKIDVYLKAKEDLKRRPEAKNVFEVDKSLQTVGILEALRRVEYLCDINITESFRGSILYINDIRNRLMHFEIELNDDEKDVLAAKLKYCYKESLDFFESHIKDLQNKIESSRFEMTIVEFDVYKEMILEEIELEMASYVYSEDELDQQRMYRNSSVW